MSEKDQYNVKDGNWILKVKGPGEPLKKLWQKKRFEADGAPVVYDGLLYISARERFMALDPESGKTVWEYKIPGKATPPVFFEDQLIFGGKDVSDNYVYSLERKTGKELWTFRTGSDSKPVYRTPLVHEDSVLCLSGKLLYVLDLKTGKKKSSLNFKRKVWHNSPVMGDGRIFALTHKNDTKLLLHCVDAASYEILWTLDTEQFISDPLYAEGLLYFIDQKGELSVINPQSGEKQTVKIVDKDDRTPSLHMLYHDGIFIVVYDYDIVALDLNSSNLLWQVHSKGVIGKPVLSGSVIYFGTALNGIMGLDVKTGEKLFHEKTDVRSNYACGLGENRLFYAGSYNEHLLTAYMGASESKPGWFRSR